MKQSRLRKSDAGKLRQAAAELHYQDIDCRRTDNINFALYILIVLTLALGLRTFIGEPVRVSGDSMFPTLINNERMVVEKLSYYAAPPQRGDVIVCFYPGYTVSCVKRVIGLPGDTISIEKGRVYLNGAPLDESAYWDHAIYDNMQPHIIQENSVFVMGDNRNYSGDSRDPRVGDIPYHKIVGRAICVLWPLDSIRSIEHILYS